MPQKTHTMHGRDHEPHGADPIRGLLPTGTGSYIERVLAEPSLLAYWPLSDTSSPAHDVSPGHRHLTVEDGSPVWGQEGPLPASIYPDAVEFNGVHGTGTPLEAIGRTGDSHFDIPGDAPFTLEIYVYADFSTGYASPTFSAFALSGGVFGGISLEVPGFGDDANKMTFQGIASSPTLNEGTWVHVAGTFDGTTHKLYFDAALVGSGEGFEPSGVEAPPVQIGGYPLGIGNANWNGKLAHAAIYDEALTQSQIASHISGGSGTVPPGWVLGTDPDGNPVWIPPGTEVEHGDGDEDQPPETGSGSLYAGTPENASGWHLSAHFEYVVLYDSNPGRFDVPSRKWVQVPFNTVRIQRRWENEVDGDFVDAWLPDDRGLTEHARNGTLLITSGMTFGDEQIISGWFTPEYPMLDSTELPDYSGDPLVDLPDLYVRAARMISITSGQVLRLAEEPNRRQFFHWPFYASSEDAVGVHWPYDNPYPDYPHWPARPLNKPLPYPKLTGTQSLTAYQTPVAHEPGFRLNQLQVTANLPAGHALALQAWQDSPWPLRFGTDKYPPYTPFNFLQQWRKRPALVVRFDYDPDTVDHDTGALL